MIIADIAVVPLRPYKGEEERNKEENAGKKHINYLLS